MSKIVALGALYAVGTASLISGVVLAQGGAAPTLTAQDQLDIRQLIDGYSHLLDNCTNNGNDYADLFTADATFGVSSGVGQGEDLVPRPRSAAARRRRHPSGTCRPQQSQGYAYHLTINPVITATPPARARSRRC